MSEQPDRERDVTEVASLDLKPALEAVLMVVDEPATVDHLAKVLQRPRRAVADALRELADEYTVQRRGFELRLVAGGWRFSTRPAYAAAVEGFVLDGQHARLTQAALETLAVVAYRQPVSRSRVSAVRGVNCDGVDADPPAEGSGGRGGRGTRNRCDPVQDDELLSGAHGPARPGRAPGARALPP
ncbi:Segregation and condensation protein B [Streptomyces californicus]